jgi:hypothetical protein
MKKVKKEYYAITAFSQEVRQNFIVFVFNDEQQALEVYERLISQNVELVSGLHNILKACPKYTKVMVKNFENPVL